ncbi:hypothetical protein H6G26_33405 [Nostoc sp. FACHB-888]|nr:hypothetical protein [Nostoc sp. FACHB-888]
MEAIAGGNIVSLLIFVCGVGLGIFALRLGENSRATVPLYYLQLTGQTTDNNHFP